MLEICDGIIKQKKKHLSEWSRDVVHMGISDSFKKQKYIFEF
jgi:hypothetical protein